MKTLYAVILALLCPVAALAEPCPKSLKCPSGAKLVSDGNSKTCMKKGKPHGPTIRCDKQVLVERRNFKGGKLEGVAEFYDTTGLLVRRERYVDGKQNGLAERWHPRTTQKQSEMMFRDAQIDGVSQHWHPNGTLAGKGTYAAGKANGEWTEWRDDGSLLSHTTFVDGLRAGSSRTYHPNGKVHVEASYVHGKLDGKWTQYDESGEPEGAGTYQLGIKVGPWTEADANGTSQGSYIDGKFDGEWKWFDRASKLVKLQGYGDNAYDGPFGEWDGDRKVREGTYRNRLPDGVWRTWDERGELTRETYDEGMKLERCDRRKGKMSCTKLIPWRRVSSRGCSVIAPGTHTINTQEEFDAVYKCGDQGPSFDWTRYRLWAMHLEGDTSTQPELDVERTKSGLRVVFRSQQSCRGTMPPMGQIRYEILLRRADTPISSRVETLPSSPCGQVP